MGSCVSSHSHTHANPPPRGIADESSASASMSRSGSWSDRWKRGERRSERAGLAGRASGLFARKQSCREDAAAANGALASSLDELSGVAGARMCSNGASEVVAMYTQQGKKGTNQDAMIVCESFNWDMDTTFCGVFDGHGPYGHLVARKVRDTLPVKLCTQWKSLLTLPHENGNMNMNDASISISNSLDSEDMECINVDEDLSEGDEVVKSFPEMFMPIKESYLRAFRSMDWDLKKHKSIDCFCSGSTAVTLVKKGFDLVVGNLGDSRAVLGTRDDDNNLIAEQLTVDLKPNLPRESARITRCNGRVFALQDEPDVARVWLPNSDSPGLAMARAFGDFCLKKYGLISVPKVSYRRLTAKDEFVILATDGIWDVLSNKEAVDIVVSAPSRATAARALVDSAVRAWKLKFPTSKSDDCAVVCLFLDEKPQSDPIDDPIEDLVSKEHDSPPKAVNFDTSIAPNKPVQEEEENQEKEKGEEGVVIRETIKPNLERLGTLQGANEIEMVIEEHDTATTPGNVLVSSISSSGSTRRLADCISNSEEEEWSALEGVTRSNSLLNLPRFLRKSSSTRKK